MFFLLRARPRVSGVWFAVWISCSACSAPNHAPARAPWPGKPGRSAEATPERRPDGIVVEVPSALPPVTDLAEATGVVALREPLPERAVARFVRALMAAVADADPEAIVAMSTPDVVGLDTASRGSKNAFRDWLTHLRTKRVAFRRLRGAEIARVDQIVLRRLQDFVERGQAGASPPPEMSPSEVLVTVPVAGTHVGSERLLPDQLVLLLRREAGGYKLSGIQLEP